MPWNPDQYQRFAEQRLRPALDLMARIPDIAPQHIVDLGCGTGKITARLAKRWPLAKVVGVDRSQPMIERAQDRHQDLSNPVQWQLRDISDWLEETKEPVADLLFSNAALHWLPEHATLFPALMSRLKPDGILAVQLPDNFRSQANEILRNVAASGPWAGQLAHDLYRIPVQSPDFYYRCISAHARTVDIWSTDYLHVLEGENAVLEWLKGTTLTTVKRLLSGRQDWLDSFEEAFGASLARAYPPEADGRTLFGFKRLFIIARV